MGSPNHQSSATSQRETSVRETEAQVAGNGHADAAVLSSAPAESTSARFNPLEYPLALMMPHWLTSVRDWHEHIPFAFALVELLRPETIVELGVYRGDSFAAMCQAVEALGLPTTCIGIDSWEGDVHTGNYGEAVYEDLLEHTREHYASFATLWRQLFDDAAPAVADGSVDLLHIDGTHTYEAVRHDFETWLVKMSARGVVMLHDVNEHQPNFGVHQLWSELADRYPSAAFAYGHGLGVVAVGSEPPRALLDLFTALKTNPVAARYFHALGERVLRQSGEYEVVQRLQRQLAAAEAEQTRLLEAAEQQQQVERSQRDRITALEAQVSNYAGAMTRLEAEREQWQRQQGALKADLAASAEALAAQRSAAESQSAQLTQLNTDLYSVRASRTYRAARIAGWPVRRAKRLLRRTV